MMYKGYKIRLFPTKEQEEKLWKHIHACRFIWNFMLNLQEENHKNGLKHLSRFETIKLLTSLKQQNDFCFLKEVSNASLQVICTDLAKSYDLFFKHVTHAPKFKSRKNTKKSYPVRSDYVKFQNECVSIEKVGKIKFHSDDIPIENPRNARISFINNKWILSFIIKCENQAPKQLNDNPMGIDLGIKELAVVSFGNDKIIFNNINKSKRVKTLEHKLKYIQRVISRKQRTNKSFHNTKNIIKYRKIESTIYNKLKNIRENYTHQVTHYLIKLMPYKIIMESLCIKDMIKNKNLSKQIMDQYFYEFIRQIKYKSEWNGIKFIQADKWYPSSKMCSCCGNIKKDLKLSDRIYKCECGLEIDRDYNAAINLMRYVSH